MKKPFVLEKKMVAVVRYYETMYLIHDKAGERIYTGNDEKTAKRILGILNSYILRKKKRKNKPLTKRKH